MKHRVPEWMRPENLRWAAYQWENKIHFARIGGSHVPFWCNTAYLDDYFDRLYSPETLRKFRELGITAIATGFSKGYGLKTETEERERQKKVYCWAHQCGLKVFGYVNSDACYYETLFKEHPELKNCLQIDKAGNWRHPESSYYPHKAKLCCSYPEYMTYMKEVIAAAMEAGCDGIHFDMAHQATCFCPECVRQFREYLEKNVTDKRRVGFLGFEYVDIPYTPYPSDWDLRLGHVRAVTDPMQQEYYKFITQRFARVRKEIYDFVKTFGEDKGVIMNTALESGSGIDPEQIRECSDAFYIESNFPYALPDGSIRTSILNYKRLEALGNVAIPTQWLMKDDKIALPESTREIQIGVLESAVYGGAVSNTWSCRSIRGSELHCDNVPLTGEFRKLTAFFDQHRDLYAGSRSLPTVSVLIGHDSYRYETAKELTHPSLTALAYVLQRANIPFRMVLEADFDPEESAVKVLIAPNLVAMSQTCADKLVRFVRNGGKLVVTGKTGDYNENALFCKENLLSAVENDPGFLRLDPPPELTFSAAIYPEVWGKHITNFPKEWKRLADPVRKFAAPSLPFTGEIPDGLFAEVRHNRTGNLVIHLLNFIDRDSAFTLCFPEKVSGKAFCYGPDDNVKIDGNTISGSCRCYAVIELQ